MSRVYEALRQSDAEAGRPAALLDADSLASLHAAAPPTNAETNTTVDLDMALRFRSSPPPQTRLVALTEDNSLGAEKFRLLRARIRTLRERQQVRRIVISSAAPEEGKTLVSINLAVSLAKHTSEKILLLEGDLRKPTFAHRLRMQAVRGIGEWFASEEPISKFLYHFDNLQLWLLPGGICHDNPLTILQSRRFLEAYNQLCGTFDWVLVDAPPLQPMADVNFWAHQTDGLLLVCREGRTPRTALKKGLETLDMPRLVGVVLNCARTAEGSYYHHYYYAGSTKPSTENS